MIKKDGTITTFNINKIKSGILKACEKRPVTIKQIDSLVSEIESELSQEESTEIPSTLIGEKIIKKLIKLDSIAYIRYASVYKNFNDLLSFKQEIQKFKHETPKHSITQVKKRDNSIALFNQESITKAIYKASKSVDKADKTEAKRLSDITLKILEDKFKNQIPTVEEIQDTVEKILIDEGHSEIAKAYILYREQHRRLREMQNLLNSNEIIEDYLTQEDWRVKENSNMDYSLQGLNNHITSTIVAKYWLNKLYPEKIRQVHDAGDLHIHDLGSLSVYCVGWDLKGLLLKGFRGVSGKVESNPPKHYFSALGQIINFFYTLQGEVAGAEAFSNFDTYLAPFIRYDNLNYNEVKQGMQEFLFNMNVPTRTGFQSPFTNITLDLKVPEFMKNENVIIGGKLMKETYSEFQKEMDIFNKAFAEVMMEGDAKNRVFTFPIPTYNITKNFEWDNPNYEPIWEMTAKYGIPYFSNFINADMKPEDVRSMCCRLRIDKRELDKRGGGLFGANPLTGSIGVVTINMARLGYLSKNESQFFQKLSYLMDISKESLVIKRKLLEIFTEGNLYPYSKFYLSEIKQAYGKYWKNHFSTIGLNGMNEACLNFLKKDISTKEGTKFTIKVLDFMRNKLSDYQEETGEIYNLEATPAEGTSYSLALKDKSQYPDIIVANEKLIKEQNAEPYYTNSTQLPVGHTDDFFEALELQDEIQTKYTGGVVLHGFIGEKLPSIQATKELVKKIAYNFKLPYYSLTPTFSICPKKHGYIAGEHEYCPKCDAEIGYKKEEVVINE